MPLRPWIAAECECALGCSEESGDVPGSPTGCPAGGGGMLDVGGGGTDELGGGGYDNPDLGINGVALAN